jgi:hypothetical protein
MSDSSLAHNVRGIERFRTLMPEVLLADALRKGTKFEFLVLSEQSNPMVGTVLPLQNSIRRLELRAEQLIIHLRSMERSGPGAERIRSVLLVMLLRLVCLKAKRARLEDEIRLDCVA